MTKHKIKYKKIIGDSLKCTVEEYLELKSRKLLENPLVSFVEVSE